MLGGKLSTEVRWGAYFIICFEDLLPWGLFFRFKSCKKSDLRQWMNSCFSELLRFIGALKLLCTVEVFNFCIVVLV